MGGFEETIGNYRWCSWFRGSGLPKSMKFIKGIMATLEAVQNLLDPEEYPSNLLKFTSA